MFGVRFLADGPDIANSIRALAIHTKACFPAGSFQTFMPDGVQRGCIVSHPLHTCLQVWYHLVAAHTDHHISGAKGNAGGTIANHVQVDKFATFADGI